MPGSLTLAPWLFAVGGGTLLALGAVLIWGERAGLAARWRWLGGVVGRTSLPTRLMSGLGLLVGGYHLVAWGFPALGLAELVGRGSWWWLLLGVGGAVGGSLALDWWESRDHGARA